MVRAFDFSTVVLVSVLAIIKCIVVSADSVTYDVTFVACVEDVSCPVGNPSAFSKAFALNGDIAKNINLVVGDELVFNLQTDTSIHPLTICQNSPLPDFCKGISGNDLLNTPITTAGSTTSYTFNTPGTYYYGCHNHPGMGATITVLAPTGGD